MPYQWIPPEPAGKAKQLHLWPYQSLAPKGFVIFIGATMAMVLIPLLAVLGTAVLWGLLPFLMLAVGGVWFAIGRNRHSAQILEVLTLTPKIAHLVRHNPKGDPQEWECNIYWAQVEMHDFDGPVPHYVTLKGDGREVEIGAFLSEDERVSLFDELSTEMARA